MKIIEPKNCSESFAEPFGTYEQSHILLAKHRHIFIKEAITKELAATVCAHLLYYNYTDPKDDITIHIHSNGGEISALIQMYDIIKTIKAPITTICLGKAYSAAAVLLSAGSKGKRVAFKNASIMIHSAQLSIFPSMGEDASDVEASCKMVNHINNNMMQIIARHTGQKIAKVREDCSRDFYLDAPEAVKYGIIDKIIG